MQNKVSDGLFDDEVYLMASDSMELATLISLLIMAFPSPSHASYWQIKNRTAACRAVLLFI